MVALGITIDGTKIPLALAEGATENATVVVTCWSGCATVGWMTRPILVVIEAPRPCAARPTCSTTR